MIEVTRIAALEGHQNPIYSVENSVNKNAVYTAGNDKGVVEWDLENFTPKVVLPVKSSVYALHTLKEQQFLAVGERSGQLTIADPESGKAAFISVHHKKPIFEITSIKRKNELLASSEDGTVSVWDLNSFNLLYNFNVSADTVRCIAVSKDESLAAFGCKDNLIQIYSLEDYSLLHTLEAHTMPVTSLQFSPDGKYLLSGARDAHLNIWDINGFTLLDSFAAHLFSIYDIEFHPTLPYFATASRDKSIKIWSSETFKLRKIISREKGMDAHMLSVNKIIWLPNKEQLISVSDDKLVMVWDIQADV